MNIGDGVRRIRVEPVVLPTAIQKLQVSPTVQPTAAAERKAEAGATR